MIRRLLVLVLLMLPATLVVTGCAAQWSVVSQASPNPFANQRKFVVAPIDYTGLMVGAKTEAEYLSEKNPDQQQKFLGDKQGINEEFAKGLFERAHDEGIEVGFATGPEAGPFVIRPAVSFIEPGFYAVVASAPSEIRMTVRITTPDGRVLDEILLKHKTDSANGWSIGGISLNPSSGGRVRKDGRALGEIMAKYLKARVDG